MTLTLGNAAGGQLTLEALSNVAVLPCRREPLYP